MRSSGSIWILRVTGSNTHVGNNRFYNVFSGRNGSIYFLFQHIGNTISYIGIGTYWKFDINVSKVRFTLWEEINFRRFGPKQHDGEYKKDNHSQDEENGIIADRKSVG